MKRLTFVCFIGLWAAVAFAPASAIGNETPAGDTAGDKAETSTVAEATETKEFEPPPGFKAKRRGKITLYCIEDSTVGTRFKTQKCYDEAGMRDYMLSRENNNRDFDQRRAVCSNPAICRIE